MRKNALSFAASAMGAVMISAPLAAEDRGYNTYGPSPDETPMAFNIDAPIEPQSLNNDDIVSVNELKTTDGMYYAGYNIVNGTGFCRISAIVDQQETTGRCKDCLYIYYNSLADPEDIKSATADISAHMDYIFYRTVEILPNKENAHPLTFQLEKAEIPSAGDLTPFEFFDEYFDVFENRNPASLRATLEANIERFEKNRGQDGYLPEQCDRAIAANKVTLFFLELYENHLKYKAQLETDHEREGLPQLTAFS